MPIVPIIILFVAGMIALVIFGFMSAAKRRKALMAVAARRRMHFSADHDRGTDERFPNFECLDRGHNRYAYNILTGHVAGQWATGFDYHYETGSGDDETSHHLSAVILQSPIPLRPLLVRPEGFFDSVKAFFGFDDIDFESAQFSRRFYVQSPDRRWAYDVIHQGMMEYLMAAPQFSLQFDSSYIIAWREKRFEPADFDAAFETVCGIFDRLPEYLIRQQTGRG